MPSPLHRQGRMPRWGRILILALLPLGLVALGSGPARADFPQDPPNDPNYQSAEGSGPTTCLQHSVNDEQHYFYSFMPKCTPAATDPENASGMSIDRAWHDFSAGRPDIVMAYIEGGINWHNGDAAELADKVYLNWRELPIPCTGSPCSTHHGTSVSDYDIDHDGVFSASDYAHDPRVTDANANGIIDPEDIIAAFSCYRVSDESIGAATRDAAGHLHCSNGAENVSNDGSGYPHDISGWDFYDNQNDPATVDSAYGHANGQMKQAGAQTNNGIGGAGICARCMILPIKAGAEALDQTDKLAQAWWFAADSGASVILSVTADLGYSSFMHQTVEALWRRGTVMAESSNDFDSTDHQGGMFWPHVLPGNGLVSNTQGIPGTLAALSNSLTTTFRERADETSWGTHNMFSVATDGGSTSESTPTIGGVMGLVLSYGRDAADQSRIARPLTGPEAIQVVRATASRISDTSLGWPGSPGDWNLQYGYGRPNVWKAMHAISVGDIPPVGYISTPDWYSLYDPTTTASVPVTGHVEATRSPRYTWKLEFAPGAQPTDAEFLTAGTGTGAGPFDGRLGTLDLSRIPASFWDEARSPYHLSQTKQLETTEQYTVTLRLRVIDAQGRVGEDRRSVFVHHDPTLLPGFPLHLGHGGEGQPALVDLQGSGHLDLVFGDTDGIVHAVDPVSRKELPGWPVTTDATVVTRKHSGINPGHEPILASVAVGDLEHTGDLSVVATSTTGKVYVFDAFGQRHAGWPQVVNTGVVVPGVPRPPMPHTRLPVQGAAGAPVLYDLAGDGGLEIIQGGWDGHIHVWRADGTNFPGWPVKVQPPNGFQPDPGHFLVNDQKLETSPTIAYLDGSGKPDIIVRSQYTEIIGNDIQPAGIGLLNAYRADGTSIPGWPATSPGDPHGKMPAIVEYYGSAQEFVTEGSNQPASADVDGSGKDKVASAAVFSPTYLFNGDGSLAAVYGPVPDATAGFITGLAQGTLSPTTLTEALHGNLPTDAPVSFATSGAFGRFNGVLTYAEPGSGGASTAASLLLNGSGNAIVNQIRAYVAATGASQPGFPARLQGLDFLGQPILTDVVGDGTTEVIDSADSSALAAYTSNGGQAAGFPKFHTGWTVYAPSAGDLLSDGHVDLVVNSREGYVFAWRTPGLASANNQWWSAGHDEHHTDRYGTDTRPPGAIRDAHWKPGDGTLSFTAPGDDWYSGTAAAYLVSFQPSGQRVRVTPSGPAGTHESIHVPPGTNRVKVQAVDHAGNLGRALVLPRSGVVHSQAASDSRDGVPNASESAAESAETPTASPAPRFTASPASLVLATGLGVLAATAVAALRRRRGQRIPPRG